MPDNKLDVRVYPLDDPKGNTKAFASVALDDVVAIRGIRVISSEKGLFVSMPQSQDRDTKKFHDIAFPLSGDLRKDISRAVLGEYKTMASLPPEQRGYKTPDMVAAEGISVEDISLDIRVYPLEDPDGSTKAFASVAIDDLVAIRGIRVVDSEKGLFVSMPQSQDNKGLFHDIAFPLSGDLRKEISKGVLEKFEAEKSIDRKPSLGQRLAEGAEKSAGHVAPVGVAAKERPGNVL
ncbi:MAG: SpoVG family protein [Oscillospiraceae bacterium]|nr:SpoVG family protein [Oscillospiraceae bacterium]